QALPERPNAQGASDQARSQKLSGVPTLRSDALRAIDARHGGADQTRATAEFSRLPSHGPSFDAKTGSLLTMTNHGLRVGGLRGPAGWDDGGLVINSGANSCNR